VSGRGPHSLYEPIQDAISNSKSNPAYDCSKTDRYVRKRLTVLLLGQWYRIGTELQILYEITVVRWVCFLVWFFALAGRPQ
jgi:hypothetical protein